MRSEITRVIQCLREGLSPSQIAEQTKLTICDVITMLKQAVHDGYVKRTEILLSFPKETRNALDTCNADTVFSTRHNLQRWYVQESTGHKITLEEVGLYQGYRDQQVHIGDTYELICNLERTLHTIIKKILVQKYGSDESGWWREGVPENVRTRCVDSRERDQDFNGDDPYSYTTVIHLKEILEKRWELFKQKLPSEIAKDKAQFMDKLKDLNAIRNRVMHPVRGEPTSDDDYQFVAELHQLLSVSQWRLGVKRKP